MIGNSCRFFHIELEAVIVPGAANYRQTHISLQQHLKSNKKPVKNGSGCVNTRRAHYWHATMSVLLGEAGVTFSYSMGSLSPIWTSSTNRFPCSPTQIHIVEGLWNGHKVDGKWYITRQSRNNTEPLLSEEHTGGMLLLLLWTFSSEKCVVCLYFVLFEAPTVFYDVSNSPAMLFTDGFGIFLALLFMISCKCKKKNQTNPNNVHFTSNILNCSVCFCLSDTSCVAAMIHNLGRGDCISLAIWRLLVWSQAAAYCRRSRTPGWLSLCSFRCITVIC